MSSSSASVDAPGTSTWIQVAPRPISASRLRRMLLRAVPDHRAPGRLLESQAVTARPAGGVVGIALVLPEQLHESFVAVDADLLAPGACVLEVALVQRLARRGLHEPRRLGQRADL